MPSSAGKRRAEVPGRTPLFAVVWRWSRTPGAHDLAQLTDFSSDPARGRNALGLFLDLAIYPFGVISPRLQVDISPSTQVYNGRMT